jgi:AMMECR1 domain-containing protein
LELIYHFKKNCDEKEKFFIYYNNLSGYINELPGCIGFGTIGQGEQ